MMFLCKLIYIYIKYIFVSICLYMQIYIKYVGDGDSGVENGSRDKELGREK